MFSFNRSSTNTVNDDSTAIHGGYFVDVLLDLGTDTVVILLEWILARMVLHPEIQAKAQSEIENVDDSISIWLRLRVNARFKIHQSSNSFSIQLEKAYRLPPIEEVNTILHHGMCGVVSTFSQYDGYTSGSMEDFTCDAYGSPILAVSSLAVHTRGHSKNFNPEDMSTQIDGRNCIVTRANSCIGYATANGLALSRFLCISSARSIEGFHLYLICLIDLRYVFSSLSLLLIDRRVHLHLICLSIEGFIDRSTPFAVRF
ncbi:hypothetical protein L6452_31984 [Arctium lappa]|uniref:Uncharacterized protein n=1 Tax=Arctium lappa TaxID=4217 RepID=A0ACB8Z4F9_ARCLA|nr:hypothetical protein L6452_31984 [Arctium lappa]